MNKFFVVINESHERSWASWVWNDVKDIASVFYDNSVLKSAFLKRLKKIHFSNSINSRIRIPFKSVWDSSVCIDYKKLNPDDRNYLIFQSTIKFSPSLIKKLKKKYNAYIVLYLPDTVKKLKLGNDLKSFKKYCDYYSVDMVVSFDPVDCKKYDLFFFDIYSSLKTGTFIDINKENNTDLFYIGSCRSISRLNTLQNIYEILGQKIKCDFHLTEVAPADMKYKDSIDYNHPLDYNEVVKMFIESKCILELINQNQTGNTLRFKEAVCYNKLIITNNQSVKENPYYDPRYVYVFDKVSDLEKIDAKWFEQQTDVKYDYRGDFSPVEFFKMIEKNDRRE